jgi:phosphoglucomutase
VIGSVFEYQDPVDKSISKNQGLIFRYQDGSRVIFRQSGTGSVGITIRIYFEKYEPTNILASREEVLSSLIEFGLKLSQVL